MKELQQYGEAYGITITEAMMEQFQLYSDFLLEYNQKVNLTAITDPKEVIIKHFLDSLLLLSSMEVKQETYLVDVGTGAGFPGVPLKIVRPDLHLTLLDSLNKRLVFLEELSEKLGQENKFVHARAEEVGRESPFREGYELVVSRAVSNLPAISEYCLPIVEVGGFFVAYKGPEGKEEYLAAKSAIQKLGGKLQEIKKFTLPDESQRSLLLIEKVKETPAKYPRRGIKIAKNPL